MTSTVDPRAVATPSDDGLLRLSEHTTERQNHVTALRARAARLAQRAATEDAERLLLGAGALLVPAGFFALIAGYWGAAHTGRVIQQIPYLISGGLLGLALVFAGGFAYFSFWSTRIARGQARLASRVDDQTAAVIEELRALRQVVQEAGLVQGGTTATGERLVTTPKGRLLHRATCRVVAGRPDVQRATGLEDGLRPCKMCRPDLVVPVR